MKNDIFPRKISRKASLRAKGETMSLRPKAIYVTVHGHERNRKSTILPPKTPTNLNQKNQTTKKKKFKTHLRDGCACPLVDSRRRLACAWRPFPHDSRESRTAHRIGTNREILAMSGYGRVRAGYCRGVRARLWPCGVRFGRASGRYWGRWCPGAGSARAQPWPASKCQHNPAQDRFPIVCRERCWTGWPTVSMFGC